MNASSFRLAFCLGVAAAALATTPPASAAPATPAKAAARTVAPSIPNLVPGAPSPFVSNVGADTLRKMYGAYNRDHMPLATADYLPMGLGRAIGAATTTTVLPALASVVQTIDHTAAAESAGGGFVAGSPANVDPVYAFNDADIVFASNISGAFHLYYVSALNSSATPVQLTGLNGAAGDERWPSISGSSIVYCQGSAAGGPFTLMIASIVNNNGALAVDTANAAPLISNNTLDAAHPFYNGGTVAFAGRTAANQPYHIYTYNVASQSLIQVTSGAGDEENPSLSPSGSLLAFDTNATAYTAGTGAPQASSATGAGRTIFITTTSGNTTPAQFTASTANNVAVNSIEPFWGAVIANTELIPTGDFVFFSSNRVVNSAGAQHYGIYYLAANSNTGGTGVTANEGSNNVAVNVHTSDPLGLGAPTGAFDNFEPAAPSFTQAFGVAYVSPRFLVNNITDNPIDNGGSTPVTGSQDNEPTDTATSPAGAFNPVGTEQGPTGGFEVLSSLLTDITPPTLVQYSTTEVVHTQDDAQPEASPTQTAASASHFVAAGNTVRFLVRLSDRQTGVGQAYLQIKDPNSKFQQLSGLEHKLFTHDPTVFTPPTLVSATPPSGNTLDILDYGDEQQVHNGGGNITFNDIYGNGQQEPRDESTTLYDLISRGLGGGGNGIFFGNRSIGGYETNGGTGLTSGVPIFLGHLISGAIQTPNEPVDTTANPYPADGVAGQGELSTIVGGKFITTLSVKDIQNLPDFAPADGSRNHMAGDYLQLYNYDGTPQEIVQIVSASYDPTSTDPITGTFTVTPFADTYMIPTGVTGYANAGYAKVIAVSRMDWFGNEMDCQAIAIGTDPATQVDATSNASFVTPEYLAGYDDQAPQSGDGNAADAGTTLANGAATIPGGSVWLPLTPVASTSGLDDANGGVLYTATWKTPSLPSDWYVDVIAYDNQGTAAQNWRIYDNIAGFTTRPFVKPASSTGGDVLVVNDYMLPQKFFSNSGRFGTLTGANIPPNFFGGESYLTDLDTNYGDARTPSNASPSNAPGTTPAALNADRYGQSSWLPDTGYEDDGWASGIDKNVTISQLFHRPAGTPTAPLGGASYVPYYPNALGVNSYVDSDQTGTTALTDGSTPRAPLDPTGVTEIGVSGLGYNNNTQTTPSQQYDIWRILCRGPVTSDIYAAYGPQTVSQPPNALAGGTAEQTVQVESNCIIWASPFAGDEFALGGTIIDPSTQSDLSSYVSGGGRLYVEGTDVGFSLTNNTPKSTVNTFYTDTLNATYLADSVPEPGDNGNDTGLVLAGQLNQTDYISNDAFLNNSGNNNPAFGVAPVGHKNFKLASTASTNNLPNWTYLPPGYTTSTGGPTLAGGLTLALDDRNEGVSATFSGGANDSRDDGSFADGGLTRLGIGFVNYVDAFSTLLPAPAATGPIASGVQASELAGTSNPAAQLVYTKFAPPTGVTFGGGIAAYSSFGLESLSQDVESNIQAGPPGFTGNNYPVYQVLAQRTDVMQNLICFLRTGTITGQVTSTSGSAQSGVEVVATPQQTGGFASNNATLYFAGLTDANGDYTISGVPAGRYDLATYAAGTSQHTTGAFVTLLGGDRASQNLQVAPTAPGTLVVTVVDSVSGVGIAGATVSATETLTGAVTTEITNSSGVATFASIPAGSYTITVSATGYATLKDPTVYTVTSSQQTSVTEKLVAAPGTITGTVTDGSGNPVSGVTITAVGTSTGGKTVTGTTNASGVYSISVPAGTYNVTASDTGYLSKTVSGVVVASGQTVTVNFTGTNALIIAPKGTIYGLISRAADGAAVSGITVTITDTTNASNNFTTTTTTTSTAPDGGTENYSVANIPYGTYTISVTAPGYPAVTPVTVTLNTATLRQNFTLASVHTFAAGLQLISVPYEYSGTGFALDNILGYTGVKLAVWQPLLGNYVETPTAPADTFHLGVGYWVRIPSSGAGLNLIGTAATTAQSVQLHPGWNEIGDPFNQSVEISNLTVSSGGTNSQSYSFGTASGSTLQLVDPTLYSYDQATNSYVKVVSGQTIDPYVGYWIQAFSTVTLGFPVP